MSDALADPRPPAARRRAVRRRALQDPDRPPRRARRHRPALMGTSHRQAPVRNIVGRVREGLAELFRCPRATRSSSATAAPRRSGTSRRFGLIREKSQHLSFGEFSSKFATAAAAGAVARRAVGHQQRARLAARPGRRGRRRRLRLGAQRDLHRRDGAGRRPAGLADDALVLIDATSGAGGLPVDLTEVDVYYFAPAEVLRLRRRPLGRDPLAARAGAGRADRRDRPLRPGVLRPADRDRQLGQEPDLQHPLGGDAVPDGRAAGLDERPGRPQGHGRADHRLLRRALRLGRADVVHRRRTSPTRRTARWSSAPSTSTTPSTPPRSPVLRANGIVDTEPYRKLGRNQLRIAMYPADRPRRRRGAHRLHRLRRRAARRR